MVIFYLLGHPNPYSSEEEDERQNINVRETGEASCSLEGNIYSTNSTNIYSNIQTVQIYTVQPTVSEPHYNEELQ
jgi:hypothetical protein